MCVCICVLVDLQFLLFFSYSILAPVVLGITLLFLLSFLFSFLSLLCSAATACRLGEGVKMYFVFPSSCLVSEVCLFLCISYCSLLLFFFFVFHIPPSPFLFICLTCKQRETVLKFMDHNNNNNNNNKKSQDKNKSQQTKYEGKAIFFFFFFVLFVCVSVLFNVRWAVQVLL